MDDANRIPHDPRLVAVRFRPGRLSCARELRGLTKTDLAEKIGKTPSAITQFESGAARPDAETVSRLALALGVPVKFFGRDSAAPGLSIDACHFRSLRSVSQYLRRQALRVGELCLEASNLIEAEGVEFPEDRLSPLKRPVQSSEDIENLAGDVRRAWGLGMGPIQRPIALFESVGLRILPLTNACAEVDAFSAWVGGRPVAMLSLQKPASRVHYDAAHELGHLLMHEDVVAGSPELESQADEFAAAFLLPRSTYLEECPGRWSLATFRALKRRWHVSIQALVVRAYRLQRLSLSSYRRAFVNIGQLGYRFHEPDEWRLEGPTVLRTALELVADDLPFSALTSEIALNEEFLRQVLLPHIPDPNDKGKV